MEETPKEKETATVNQRKGGRKWLGRFVKFLMYGGWLLIVIVGVGLAIAISIWTKGC